MLAVIDLFCGVGGLTHGFVQEGFNVIAGVDTDQSCEYAYSENNRSQLICKSVAEISGSELVHLYGAATCKILVGCAPCQQFSLYNNYTVINDKWTLLDTFAALVKQVNPDIVSMENVPELYSGSICQDTETPLFTLGSSPLSCIVRSLSKYTWAGVL